jgi:glycosyltransferase involved in cell wall biosynthesis
VQTIKVSVIICTYNPDRNILEQVLKALSMQTLEQRYWELIIVDNNSDMAIAQVTDIQFPHSARIITEAAPGLVFARIAGFNACTKGTLIVFIDDDNVAAPDYLEQALRFNEAHPQVGCFGGRSIPAFETAPPNWLVQTGINLGCQDFGEEPYMSAYAATGYQLQHYPEKAPIGTGMVIQHNAFAAYMSTLNSDKLSLGRKAAALTSGEDNDIVITIVKNGYEIAYVPQLIIRHLIPARRYSYVYLKEMAFKSNVSWMRVLTMHQINPHSPIPGWTVPLRQYKAWFVLSAWKSRPNYIKWCGVCGMFKGLSAS